MAQVQLRIAVRKRWFFWPAFWTIASLAKLGIIREFYPAASWLVDHGMIWEAA